MRKSFIIPAVCLVMLAFVVKSEHNMKQFEWLKGSWTMKTKKGTIMESWHGGNDSTLLGESLLISVTGQSKVVENLRLSYEGGTYYYISKVNGQNSGEEIKFKLTSYTEKGFVAENPNHDFPKRIIYDLIGKDSIHAYIDGGVAAPDKRSDFYYSRMKN